MKIFAYILFAIITIVFFACDSGPVNMSDSQQDDRSLRISYSESTHDVSFYFRYSSQSEYERDLAILLRGLESRDGSIFHVDVTRGNYEDMYFNVNDIEMISSRDEERFIRVWLNR